MSGEVDLAVAGSGPAIGGRVRAGASWWAGRHEPIGEVRGVPESDPVRTDRP